MTDRLIILKDIPDVKWTEDTYQPICREHHFKLDAGHMGDRGWEDNDWNDDSWCYQLRCLEGPHVIKLHMPLGEIRTYAHKKLESRQYSEAKLVDLDGLLTPVSSKDKAEASNNKYFVTSQVKSGKRGDQLVIYAGKKGSKNKAQIFIDPEHKKMSFDQNDLNPTDIFTKLEATFRDGTRHIIQSGEKE